MKRLLIITLLLLICLTTVQAVNAPSRIDELMDQLQQIVLRINECDAIISQKQSEKLNLTNRGYKIQGAIEELERQAREAENANKEKIK